MKFTQSDLAVFKSKEISSEEVSRQIRVFQEGVPFISLKQPCTLGHGIRALSNKELQKYISVFDQVLSEGRVTKFVPASGAASRMFKALLAFYHSSSEVPQNKKVEEFFDGLSHFAFYQKLSQKLKEQNEDLDSLLAQKKYQPILSGLLSEQGLHYAHLPKGLLLFHAYPDHARTPMEEHLVEAIHYTQDRYQCCRVHFTISQEFRDEVEAHLQSIKASYEQEGIKFKITLSHQKQSTDTVAVDLENQPFRLSDQKILFRPGGHGALLENLNDLKGDIVFIKNIDNVTIDTFKPTTYQYKKALGGLLVELQGKIFSFLRQLEEPESLEVGQMEGIGEFIQSALGNQLVANFKALSKVDQVELFRKVLNRPLRVCGMVPNQGEVGGGPFWVKMSDGSVTCQIVESAQVDLNDSEQSKLFAEATHFNPVDLVCGLRDYRGHPFDLKQFVDEQAVLITKKSKEGRELKALERPGLWNGGMAFWNTVFVEVPLATFTPVKTVNDLLRPEHQVD